MIKRAFSFSSVLPLPLAATLVCGALLCTVAGAQELSADGRRWVEVEVLVFRNLAVASSEIANAGKLALAWPSGVRVLESLDSSYAYPFPADLRPFLAPAPPQDGTFSTPAFPAQGQAGPEEAPSPQLDFSVPYSPAQPNGFKVLDYAHDPYIALDQRDWKLSSVARNLRGSSEYELLWHQGWRQPLLQPAQVAAIAIQGGVPLDTHTALEGSVRLSAGTGVQATVDASLWLSEPGRPAVGEEDQWNLPPLPAVLQEVMTQIDVPAPLRRDGPAPLTPNTLDVRGVAPSPAIARIWQLRENRSVNPGELYYLDHPHLGVLLEVRPYVLPELIVPESTDDF